MTVAQDQAAQQFIDFLKKVDASNPNQSDYRVALSSYINTIVNNTLYVQTSAVTVTNSTVETSLLTAPFVIPANYFTSGKVIRLNLAGIHTAQANPNINVKVKIDGVNILTTGVVASGNSTNAFVEIRGFFTCYQAGKNGIISGQGFYEELGGGVNDFAMINTGTFTLDTTIPQTMDVTYQWGTQSTNNSISITDGIIQGLN